MVLAFRNNGAEDKVQLPLRALQPSRSYELMFANIGARSTVSGADLLRDGVAIALPQSGMSEVILLKAR